MKIYKADLHIHSILSPCGDLEMSPQAIVDKAIQRGLDIIAITDHNALLQAPLVQSLGKKAGLAVWCGAEVTSKEEAHCLALFDNLESQNQFQNYLDENILQLPNNPDKFGYQVVVDENEEIIQEYPWLLISAIDQSIDQIAEKVHSLEGLFIPAHVNRHTFSLISQLGFIPPDIDADALEISYHITYKSFRDTYPYLNHLPLITSSDAHFLNDIGKVFTKLMLNEPTISEFKLALKGLNGREIVYE